jgi:serine/threonine-protein kinase
MEAHALGIVHRDIKPSNVLLSDYSGEIDFVKVLDFGVARDSGPGASGEAITRAGQMVGTPSYMAPEQIHGTAIGPTADLYALGLVMAEAASGVRVYDDGSAMQIWMRQTSAEPVPLPAVVLSSALGPVIARATRKVASERYPSAAAMLADVERAMLAGGGDTDPLAKPLSPPVQELPRITARLTPPAQATPPPPPPPAYQQPPPPAYAPTPHASSSGGRPSWASPSSSSRTPSIPSSQPNPATGSSAAIVILGVIAILAILVAAGAGGALYYSRKQAGAGPAGPSFDPKAHGRLAAVTPERTEKRLRQAGWEIVPSQPIAPSPGFRGTFFGIGRGAQGGQVMLYDYDSEALATQVERSMHATPASVVERDGGRILLVLVSADPVESRKLFDELVR